MIQYIIQRNIEWKIKLIKPFFNGHENVLDFGCGDLSLARALKTQMPNISVTGIDVVGQTLKKRGLIRIIYDGKKLPFRSNTFDIVIAFHVFHHCEDQNFSYRECMRVTKKKVIFVEPIVRFRLERYSMGLMDWLYNSWKKDKIPFTFEYKTKNQWNNCIKNIECFRYKSYEIPSIGRFLPFGKAILFEVSKK